jgi:hypothetical protein
MIDPEVREDSLAITPAMLRQFAFIWITIFGALAVYNGVWSGRPGRAAALGVLALVVGLPGIVRPSSIEVIFRTAMAVAMPIGLVISTVLLGAIFYLVFTPIATVFRLMKRDALGRRVDPGPRSSWTERPQTTNPDRYLHQS